MAEKLDEGFIKTQENPEVFLHYVEDKKNPKGPLVLLLHGFPEFWFAWKDYLAPLANAGFHPVALDLRGYNKSSHPERIGEYEFDHLVEDINTVIKKFNKKTFLVGHDWGGILTWEFATRYPKACAGIVVINAPHRSAWRDNLNFKQMKKSWYTYVFQIPKLPELWLRSFNFKAIEKIFKKQPIHPQAYPNEDINFYKQALGRRSTLKAAVNYYRANLKHFGEESDQQIKNPTLLIWGEKDAALESSILQNLQKYIDAPFSKKVYPDASHWVHREKPLELVKEMLNFFEANSHRA